MGLGASLIIKGNFTVGMFLAFQGFMASFMAPVNSLIEAGQSIQEMRTSMERVEDVLKYPVDAHPAAAEKDKTYKKLSGALSMRDVSFGYSKLASPLIEHFDLELKPGATVAFVGSSGCGKSTLAKLISGLYKPWGGEIRFDGVLLEEIPREVVTGSLAVVDQDITIFEDTIANNIKMWDKSIEDFEMILAAKDAQIHGDVMLRDKGYNYPMVEGGRDFSGGQRQRLEIARLLAQDPTIIILDEATSALDAKTEHEVVEAIRKRDITCIFVAHRLSTIRDCDEIIVMDKGQVAERGTHEELFARGGLYSQLITTE
jgi:ABC-type bacteriocin/lantibiotic exporter with double-glycine peptidase domain